MDGAIELLSEHRCYDGAQRYYRHASREIGLPMRFSAFVPAQALGGKPAPALLCLPGLTCTEETFMIKAGAQRFAAREGLVLIAPDTSPRGAGIEGETASWDFGAGAGFYLDASEPPWSRHYRMESYLIHELLPLAIDLLRVDRERIGITGHSMGGHGALVLAMRHPGVFRSLSAFAPIAAPTQCPWGRKAFSGYLGGDETRWQDHDASILMARQDAAPFPSGILVDQGLADQFLEEQLKPDLLESACAKAGQPLTLRRHAGYDHGYFFITSFIDDHITHHITQLGRNA
ncbi:S-formylglutathione hydrolase [Noviherbaspirillum galbum]|uniref:S-formylglutathione hydrolase n=1 Tax=Noviherbaspirillum galbum TaxID=2709383 RepID=A0A6B3SUN4_9BURK|nr:S-formylglutathione hydrolase [Noviherbaspirillum galbum]NEX64198.1 S-formylglutathione hydrolase [Noviherbaspirillum galbum]